MEKLYDLSRFTMMKLKKCFMLMHFVAKRFLAAWC